MTAWTDATQPPPAPGGTPGAAERQWAMFAHLSAIVGGLLTSQVIGGIGCILGPLIIWLAKKDTMPFVADQAREALNFNISVALVMLAGLLLGLLTLGIGLVLAAPVMLVVGIAALVLVIIAAIRANDGVAYRYPFALRLVK